MKEIYTDEEYLKFCYRDFLNAEKALYESKGGVCINYLNNIIRLVSQIILATTFQYMSALLYSTFNDK